MYKLVKSQKERDLFHQIKKSVWDEKGFDMEYGKEGSDLYLIYAEDGVPGGTFEFTPYSRFTAPIMKELFNDVIQKDMRVMEIDSFAVLPQYRGKLGRQIMCLVIDYAQKNGYTHAIGISDPAVFRSFNNTYQIRTIQVKEKIWYKGAEVIPALLHLKEVYDNIEDEKFSWFTRPNEMRKGVFI
ncbi:GNAT family N-acetyltransferase [Peribacillus asahii]|uniref:GNAT family N-acetyltransferase n=1 Tax=Peribacillus asahii TaxID=228899 RepID=UPI0037F195DD